MGPPEVKGRGECAKIRKRSKGCVEWYTLCAYGSGVQVPMTFSPSPSMMQSIPYFLANSGLYLNPISSYIREYIQFKPLCDLPYLLWHLGDRSLLPAPHCIHL